MPSFARHFARVLPAIVIAVALSSCISHPDRVTKVRWSSGLENRTVEVRGSVDFTDDDRDVKSISPGGSISIEVGNWLASKRSYRVHADSSGELTRTYKAGGRIQTIDDNARA